MIFIRPENHLTPLFLLKIKFLIKAAERFVFFSFIITFAFISCKKSETKPGKTETDFYRAADLSALQMVENKGIKFYDADSNIVDVPTFLKSKDFNCVRLRLWHSPENKYSGFEEVKQFCDRLKQLNLKIWLSVHYSDTWADPGHQETPAAWKDLPFSQLKDSVYNYTSLIMKELNPDIIQIGNEVNNGFLLPDGDIYSSPENYIQLVDTAIKAVRNSSAKTKIMLHVAGLNVDNYFKTVEGLDYDIIGLSFYPIWHGKSLETLAETISYLYTTYNKNIAIAETAYPFTLGWNDWTNNIVGLDEQLILPDYPADVEGQYKFFKDVYEIVKNDSAGIGISYWGAELVAFDGPESKNGSPWENQALFDFNFKAVKATEVFNDN